VNKALTRDCARATGSSFKPIYSERTLDDGLITGGAGYIGSAGERVVTLDDLSDGG
jgi:hypothetical protein